MRTVRGIAVCAFVSVSMTGAAAVRVAEGAAAPSQPPKYRVNVIEWTSAGYYGDDLNDLGQAALTGRSPNIEFGAVARRWDPRDGFVDVGPEWSLATGINNRGDVTVVGIPPGGPRDQSWLWTQRDGLIDIGGLSPDGLTFADAVNDRGQVVGWSEDVAGGRYAFLWTKDGGMQNLGDLPGGEVSSTAHHVTQQGLVVGHSYAADGMFAFRWTEKDGMRSLGDLPGGRAESAAKAANDRGQIVGVGHVENDYARAVLWDAGGSMHDLGVLRPGDISHADDINDRGQIVGWSAPHPGGTSLAFVPFLWTEEHGMLDLHDLLDEQSDAWRLSGFQMGGINDRGQILLSGSLDGQFARILLTPINPEPATLLTCVSAGLLLLQRRRASHRAP